MDIAELHLCEAFNVAKRAWLEYANGCVRAADKNARSRHVNGKRVIDPQIHPSVRLS